MLRREHLASNFVRHAACFVEQSLNLTLRVQSCQHPTNKMSRKVFFRGKGAPRSPSYKLGGPDLTSRSEWSHGMRMCWNLRCSGRERERSVFSATGTDLSSTAQTVPGKLLTRVGHLVCAPVEQDAAMSYKLRV